MKRKIYVSKDERHDESTPIGIDIMINSQNDQNKRKSHPKTKKSEKQMLM